MISARESEAQCEASRQDVKAGELVSRVSRSSSFSGSTGKGSAASVSKYGRAFLPLRFEGLSSYQQDYVKHPARPRPGNGVTGYERAKCIYIILANI